MRKILFVYIIAVIWLILPNVTFGILSDPLGLDMYKKVDKWIYDLELKYLEKELKWWDVGWSIADDLNKRASVEKVWENCFKWNMSATDVEKMYNGDLTLLDKYVDEKCKWKVKEMTSQSVRNLLTVVNYSYVENSQKAQTKVDNIYKIGRIWMYSDGIDENSPFDLMSDLKEIDKIIFESEIPYNGVNTEDLWAVTDGILNGLSMNEAMNLGWYRDHIMFAGKYKQNLYPEKQWSLVDGNTQVCNINDSWLNASSLSGILSDVKNKNLANASGSAISSGNTNTGNKNTNAWWAGWWYKKVNDNAFWPCNQFFCIVIKFVVYKHNLLWWGSNLSIEWIFKRSNEHMKKAASTSLIQSRMTTNLYELWLKDLNLPDTFHVWTQVSYKPVPLLNVELGWKDQETDEFKYKNMLTRYYRNLWLDYERANDLNIFKQKEAELKSVIDATELAQIQAEEKNNNFGNYIDRMKKENDFVSNTVIDKKIIQEDMQDFYKQFGELESFTRAMMDYTIWAWWVVKKMKEIPQWSGS